MVQCPTCGATQNEEYGMVTCPGCEAILFIDMEGNAHVDNAFKAQAAHFEAPIDQLHEQVPDEGFQPFAIEVGFQPLPEAESEPPVASFEAVPDLGPADDPLGINAYANSEISQGRDGLLLFRVLISGIDSKEIRESIREAIRDMRFGWEPTEIMASISKGKLVIEQLPPVKAAILINRIKRLPIAIRWEQYAITQMDEPPAS